MTSYMMMPIEDAKFILAGLRMYGDTLAEVVCDSNLTAEEVLGFEADSKYVERLIDDIEQFIEDKKYHELLAQLEP